MKKIYFPTFLAMIVIGLVSCSFSYPEPPAGETQTALSGKELIRENLTEGTNRESQLESIQSGEAAQGLARNGLKLVRYNQRSGEFRKESILAEIFDPGSYVPQFINANFDFTLRTIRERYSEDNEGTFSEAIGQMKKFLEEMDWDDIAVYDMYWDYRGKEIRTISLALMSLDAFFYDNILSNTIIPPSGPKVLGCEIVEPGVTRSAGQSSDRYSLDQAYTVTSDNDDPRVVTLPNALCTFGWKDEPVNNNYGKVILTFTLQHNVYGDIIIWINNNGEYARKVIFKGSYTYSNYHVKMIGWAGNAQCVRRDINPVMDGYSIADWAWGIASGINASVSIRHVGVGFSITGASQQHQGTDEVREWRFLQAFDMNYPNIDYSKL